MSNARRAALHLLNSDWSRSVWKHWLSNIFLPPVEPPRPSTVAPPATPAAVAPMAQASAAVGPEPSAAAPSAAAPAAVAPAPVSTAPRPAASVAAPANRASAALGSSCTELRSEPPDSTRVRDARRSELRARFDALSERLLSVEDGLDTLLRRSAQRDKLERRSDQQSVEAIDSVAFAGERQAAVLESLLDTVTRLEHSVSRLEHGMSRIERAQSERNRRDSHLPAPPAVPSQPPRASQYPESHLAPRDRLPLSGRGGDLDDSGGGASGIHGNLSEMSLSTVLAMLEIERHTGRLKVATEDGMLASFELTEGSVVSSRLSENDNDPLQTLRTALCWKQGRFWFRQQPAEVLSFPPRSIGSLLLEATRQNDESFANVG
jgi:Domain of unknown function (DUF4388)